MNELFTTLVVAAILGNTLYVVCESDSEKELQSSHVTLTCKNSTGFKATGLRTLTFLEWQSTSLRENCATEWCYIRPEDGLRNLVMLLVRNYQLTDVIFPHKTWKDGVLGIEFDGSLITLSPNNTGFLYELPRRFFSPDGTFSMTCIDPSKTTTLNPTEVPPEATSNPSKLSTTHIIVIVIVLFIVCSLVVIIAIIFLYRKLRVARKTSYKPPPGNNNDATKRSDNDLAPKRLGNGYTSLDVFNKDAPYDGDSPLHSESSAVYVDPEKECPTMAPDHYDNKQRQSNLPGQNEYSYTYAEPKIKPKVKKPTLKPKPKPNGGNIGDPKKKKALLPPKTPLKPKSALQSGTEYNRQPSELHYEEVEAPESTGSRTVENMV